MERVESKGVATFCAIVATLVLPWCAAAAAGPASSCTRLCGNISIPYPFGVEPGCYHATGFNLTCNNSYQPPRLFLGNGTVRVLEISVPSGTVRISSSRIKFGQGPYSRGRITTGNVTWGAGLPDHGPFFLSESVNKLQAVGCNIQVDLLAPLGVGGSYILAGSCISMCPMAMNNSLDPTTSVFPYPDGGCAGLGCCEANINLGCSFYNIQIQRVKSSSYTPILHYPGIYIIEQDSTYEDDRLDAPATLDWTISSSTCPTNTSAPECCSANSFCRDYIAHTGRTGYRCLCSQGYQGNPYVHGGCEDIDECKFPDIYLCYGNCINTPGSFTCQCPPGFTGNASVPNGCKDIDECEHQQAYSCYGICQNFPGSFHCQCPDGMQGNSSIKGGCITIKNSSTGLSIGLGVGAGTSLLLLAIGGPYIMHKLRLQKVNKMKRKFYKQNHGILLQQLISCNTDIGERMIITLRDIEKATNNFDSSRVIGGGGHGVVFKGILDLHVVAIKKSKIVVQREINEFINEVAVLSQVNHRNVVKLLGCCLETEVPLLVYEFISNGTLYHHLHVEESLSLFWDHRMRIMIEVAKALSYLHSSASMPIFHRDIKSSNILLDDSLIAKVSDFGASRYIPIDQTGVTTAVQGTMGYLDPMYYYTCRLTDKSDVFSFGVLLIELLTRKKPYAYRSVDDDGLVSHFVSLLAKGKVVDIIDPQVIEEEDGEIHEVATLAAMCTKLKGEDRPTMREVEMTLENLLIKKSQVPCNGTQTRNDGNQTTAPYMLTNRHSKEASRQYTMEEEMLLSASYPR
ncbi:unnamed protein product [Urochloa humidicola]